MHWNWKRSATLGALACGLFALGPARAELPVEQFGMSKLSPSTEPRLYLTDPAMGHLLDGRVHLLDGRKLNYLGLLTAGFSGSFVANPARKELVVITTYHSRLARGTRTDVVEVYDAETLELKHEIEVPPKHAQGLAIKALQAISADGRYLFFQNATPAQSIAVVDLERKAFVGEIINAGCWGVIPWQADTHKLSTVCGDGTLTTITLSDEGKEASRANSPVFFDPDKDPVFIHYERTGDELVFVSYGGMVHQVGLGAQGVKVSAPWSLLTPGERQQAWRPGGFQLFTLDTVKQQLIVGVHAKAKEGSHKSLAEGLWVYDLAQHKRMAKAPGHGALSMQWREQAGEPARLYVLNGATNEVLLFEPRSKSGLSKPVARSLPVGDSPVYLESRP